MNQDDFKKILEEALNPIKETQKEHTRTLESLQVSVVTIESTINAFGDMYKINDSNIRKMEKRLETVEEDADIKVPPELILAEV